MASTNTLIKNLLNVKNTVVESAKNYTDGRGVKHLRVKARPDKKHQCRCPFCGKKCPKDGRSFKDVRVWRGLDFGGVLVEIESESETQRIKCPMTPEHRKYLNYNESEFTSWGSSIGEHTASVVRYFLTSGKETEQGYCFATTAPCATSLTGLAKMWK